MPDFRICTLSSGSSGNAIYAQSPEGAIIIDAGISGKAITEAISLVGGHIDRVDGLILTHSHNDHCQGAGILARRHGLPLFMTEGAFNGCRTKLGRNVTPRLFRPGTVLAVGGFHIHTILTPHDCAESVALVLERGGLRCGILTDLGHPFPKLERLMTTLDAAVLEFNYDPDMLSKGPYPPGLKRRIVSGNGHISNQQAAKLLDFGIREGRLKALILAHLSEINNTPQLALQCAQHVLQQNRKTDFVVHVAPRHHPSPILHLIG